MFINERNPEDALSEEGSGSNCLKPLWHSQGNAQTSDVGKEEQRVEDLTQITLLALTPSPPL